MSDWYSEEEPPRCDCGLPATSGDLCSDCLPTCTHGNLTPRLEAFARTCVENGDMTPVAAHFLRRILKGEL